MTDSKLMIIVQIVKLILKKLLNTEECGSKEQNALADHKNSCCRRTRRNLLWRSLRVHKLMVINKPNREIFSKEVTEDVDSHYTKPKADVNKEKQKLTIICSKFQLKAKELEAESLMMLPTPNKSKLQLTNQT